MSDRETKEPACQFSSMSDESINDGIAEISAMLKGPMSNLERQLLIADRGDLREEKRRRESQPQKEG